LNLLALVIATTEDYASVESAIAEVVTVELVVNERNALPTALDMEFASARRRGLRVPQCSAPVTRDGTDLIVQCQIAPTIVPTTESVTTEPATATTNGKDLTALSSRTLAPITVLATVSAIVD